MIHYSYSYSAPWWIPVGFVVLIVAACFLSVFWGDWKLKRKHRSASQRTKR